MACLKRGLLSIVSAGTAKFLWLIAVLIGSLGQKLTVVVSNQSSIMGTDCGIGLFLYCTGDPKEDCHAIYVLTSKTILLDLQCTEEN
jgi:hypothetical protein